METRPADYANAPHGDSGRDDHQPRDRNGDRRRRRDGYADQYQQRRRSGDSGPSSTGNSGNDVLSGGAGNDTFDGGGGSATLVGGGGDDTYLFGRDSGQMVIEPAVEGGSGTLAIKAGTGDLWFASNGADLDVTALGFPDSVTIKNWSSASLSPVNNLLLSDRLVDRQRGDRTGTGRR